MKSRLDTSISRKSVSSGVAGSSFAQAHNGNTADYITAGDEVSLTRDGTKRALCVSGGIRIADLSSERVFSARHGDGSC